MARKKHARVNGRSQLTLIVRHACRMAESIFGGGNGAAKRKWVATTINAAVDIPFLNEKQEQATLETIIDLVVGQLNRGKAWQSPGFMVPPEEKAAPAAE